MKISPVWLWRHQVSYIHVHISPLFLVVCRDRALRHVAITLLHLQRSATGQKLPVTCPSKAGTHSQALSSPVRFKECLVKLIFVELITSRGKCGCRKEKTSKLVLIDYHEVLVSVCWYKSRQHQSRVQTSCVWDLHGALPLDLQSWKLCFAR